MQTNSSTETKPNQENAGNSTDEPNEGRIFPINPIRDLIKFYEDEKRAEEEKRLKDMVTLEDKCFNNQEPSYSTYLVEGTKSTKEKSMAVLDTLADDAISCSPSQWTQSSTGSSRYNFFRKKGIVP